MKYAIGDKVRLNALSYFDPEERETFYYDDRYELDVVYTISLVTDDPDRFPYKVEDLKFYIPEDILSPASRIRRH